MEQAARALIQALAQRGLFNANTAVLLRRLGFLHPRRSWQTLLDLTSREVGSDLLTPLLQACGASFDADRALTNFSRFLEETPDRQAFLDTLEAEALRLLVTVFSGSQYLSDILLCDPNHWQWLRQPGTLLLPKLKEQLWQELMAKLEGSPSHDLEAWSRVLRQCKQREYLRIGLRDLLRQAETVETLEELSNVADVCLQGAYQCCQEELLRRHGQPLYRDAEGKEQPCQFAILGMGKLGGRELNFSSDIDLLYLYTSDEGGTTGLLTSEGRPFNRVSNHEFYTKLAQLLTRVISDITPEGRLFRVDLRLRPEGKMGDLVYSLRSYEVYYESWGQTWERQALLKVRVVAGSESLGQRFLQLIQPFVFRKYLDFSALEEIRGVKERIDCRRQHRHGEGQDVKLGYGGIREIEFIVQAFQLIYGGQEEWIRERNTLRALHRLAERGLLAYEDFSDLSRAYLFLRDLENRLQIVYGLQTHTLPRQVEERASLARKLGLKGQGIEELAQALMDSYAAHTRKVRRVYDQLFHAAVAEVRKEEEGPAPLASSLFLEEEDRPQTLEVLKVVGFTEPERVLADLLLLYNGPPFSHPSLRAKQLLQQLLPRIIPLALATPEPGRAINTLERFVAASESRETLFALLLDNGKVLELLLTLFGHSEFLSHVLIRHPGLIDALLTPGGIGAIKSKETLADELAASLRPLETPVERADEMRRFKAAEELRIALRDILGEVDLLGSLRELSDLAQVYLQQGLILAESELQGLYGVPRLATPRGDEADPGRFAVIGLGKLGGRELTYGSDLDVVFVYSGEGQTMASAALPASPHSALANHDYYTRLGERLIQLTSGITRAGFAYKLDCRLRPEGKQGALALSLDGYQRYVDQRAETWERQAFIKARPVAGDVELGRRFMALVHRFVYREEGTPDPQALAASIGHMRQRMERELARETDRQRHIKWGRGGLVEIEFIVQFLQLAHGGRDRRLRSPCTLEALAALREGGYLPDDACADLRAAYLFLRHLESRLRMAYGRGVDTLEIEGNRLLPLSKGMGLRADGQQPLGHQLLEWYDRHTSRVRSIYRRTFGH